VQRVPRSVPLGHIPPGHPGAEPPHDPVQNGPVIQPLAAQQRNQQQRTGELPVCFGQFMATYRPTIVPHQDHVTMRSAGASVLGKGRNSLPRWTGNRSSRRPSSRSRQGSLVGAS
jgi:hypothetical protein